MKLQILLGIKTGNELAELLIIEDGKLLKKTAFPAHRELSKKIIPEIEKLLKKNKLDYGDLTGLVVYLGPGSFTGLRIGLAVADSIAFALDLPIYALSRVNSDDWWKKAIKKKPVSQVLPFYGASPKITK